MTQKENIPFITEREFTSHPQGMERKHFQIPNDTVFIKHVCVAQYQVNKETLKKVSDVHILCNRIELRYYMSWSQK